MFARKVTAIAVTLAAFTIAGCGGGGGEAQQTTTPPAQVLTPAEHNLVADFEAELGFAEVGQGRDRLAVLYRQVAALAARKPLAVYDPNAASTVPAQTLEAIVADVRDTYR